MTSRFTKALSDLRNGIPIVLSDSAHREDEGDIVIAGEKATLENLAFTVRFARGIMCLPCDGTILDRLNIPMMVQSSTDKHSTPFTVSIDATKGITTGVSVSDRLKTIEVLLNPGSEPSDLSRPGHLFPLRPHAKGLRGRQGHTEGSIELMRLAGMKPVAVISEIINDDGTMARGKSLFDFATTHGLTLITIDEIIDHLQKEQTTATRFATHPAQALH